MNANAPEKVYVVDATFPDYVDFDGSPINTKSVDDHDIEYVRTDAFIEKAANWIENNLSKYSELTDEDEYGNKLKEPEMNVFYGQAVRDFRKYMEGE